MRPRLFLLLIAGCAGSPSSPSASPAPVGETGGPRNEAPGPSDETATPDSDGGAATADAGSSTEEPSGGGGDAGRGSPRDAITRWRDSASGHLVLEVDLGQMRSGKTLYTGKELSLRADIGESAPVRVVYHEMRSVSGCQATMKLEADGERVPLSGEPDMSSAHVTLSTGRGSMGGYQVTITGRMARRHVDRLAKADQVAITVCDTRAILTAEQRDELTAFHEELGS